MSQNIYSKVQTQNAKLKLANLKLKTPFIRICKIEFLRLLKNVKIRKILRIKKKLKR